MKITIQHCCGSCIYKATSEGGGWGRFATQENQHKTDWCAICNHRAEGLNMPTKKNQWNNFAIAIDAKL